jgi:hypothetical protein
MREPVAPTVFGLSTGFKIIKKPRALGRLAVRRMLPGAQLVVDLFHVVHLRSR